jgi:hypothetical protein
VTGIQFLAWAGIFLFAATCRLTLGPIQIEDLSLGMEWLGAFDSIMNLCGALSLLSHMLVFIIWYFTTEVDN